MFQHNSIVSWENLTFLHHHAEAKSGECDGGPTDGPALETDNANSFLLTFSFMNTMLYIQGTKVFDIHGTFWQCQGGDDKHDFWSADMLY